MSSVKRAQEWQTNLESALHNYTCRAVGRFALRQESSGPSRLGLTVDYDAGADTVK